MSQCQACGGKSPDAFLCQICQRELRDMLRGLAIGHPLGQCRRSVPWLDALDDAVNGQAKLGESARRAKSHDSPMRGNGRARELFAEAQSTLTTWVRHLCETRGVSTQNVRGYAPSFVGALQIGAIRCERTTGAPFAALWLAQNLSAIAGDEGAGQCHSEVKRIVDTIERVINRPVPPRFVGPCSTLVIDAQTHRERECGTRLMAKREASTVYCRVCKTEHDVERVINRLLANVDHWRFTREELIGSRTGDWTGIMGLLEEPVSKSTFHRWSKDGLLKPSGFRRPDGTNGIARRSDDDVPIYRLSRVRQLRVEQGSKQAQAMRWVG